MVNHSIDLTMCIFFYIMMCAPMISQKGLQVYCGLHHATHFIVGGAATICLLHARCTEHGLSEVLTEGAPVR